MYHKLDMYTLQLVIPSMCLVDIPLACRLSSRYGLTVIR